jgi:hypothetical protein
MNNIFCTEDTAVKDQQGQGLAHGGFRSTIATYCNERSIDRYTPARVKFLSLQHFNVHLDVAFKQTHHKPKTVVSSAKILQE